MKLTITMLAALSLCGCAQFRTTQTDTRYNEKTGEKTTITTKASATTFFDSKSQLSSFKAAQTEKSQGASVGSLTQESSGSNAVSLAESIARGATEGAMKAIAK